MKPQHSRYCSHNTKQDQGVSHGTGWESWGSALQFPVPQKGLERWWTPPRTQTFQGDVFPVPKDTLSPSHRSLAESGPFVQVRATQSQTTTPGATPGQEPDPRKALACCRSADTPDTSGLGPTVPEAHGSVCARGLSPGASASSAGSLPGADHTRETNLAHAARPAPRTQRLRGTPEPGCSLARPAQAQPSAPGCLHRGKGRELKHCKTSSQRHSLRCSPATLLPAAPGREREKDHRRLPTARN